MFGSPSTTNTRRGSLKGSSKEFDFTSTSMLCFALAGEYPQVVAEHAPADGGDKTLKSLEKTATQPKRAFQHRNSAFDARPKRLAIDHQLVGVVLQPRRDRQRVHQFFQLREGLGVGPKTHVGGHEVRRVAIEFFVPFDQFLRQAAIGRRTSIVHLVIRDEFFRRLAKQDFMPELDRLSPPPALDVNNAEKPWRSSGPS